MSPNAGQRSIPQLVAQWRGSARPPRTVVATTESLVGAGQESLAPAAPPRMTRGQAFEWLCEALRVAVQLEFATIPPYLCALWSIKNDLHPVARSIREVVQEEMLHMALTCNMLAAIGEPVELCKWAPTYPSALPGDVHVGLEVKLRGLDDKALESFVWIEAPSKFPDNVDPIGNPPPVDRTIGDFYESILAAFRYCQPELSVDQQVSGPLAWMVIPDLDYVEQAIRLIQRQGEGAVLGPLDSDKSDLAHYYRFLEILHGKRMVYDEPGDRFVWRGTLSRPDAWPMAPVPPGGYQPCQVPQAETLFERFDATYSDMLRELQNAWQPGGQGSLIHAIDRMFELQRYARPLMEIPLSLNGPETFGPQFRYRSKP